MSLGTRVGKRVVKVVAAAGNSPQSICENSLSFVWVHYFIAVIRLDYGHVNPVAVYDTFNLHLQKSALVGKS